MFREIFDIMVKVMKLFHSKKKERGVKVEVLSCK